MSISLFEMILLNQTYWMEKLGLVSSGSAAKKTSSELFFVIFIFLFPYSAYSERHFSLVIYLIEIYFEPKIINLLLIVPC